MRPYNFYLNPVPDRKLKIEREFTYQSGGILANIAFNTPDADFQKPSTSFYDTISPCKPPLFEGYLISPLRTNQRQGL